MEWTKELPTKVGTYCSWGDGDEYIVLLRVELTEDTNELVVWNTADDGWLIQEYDGSWWMGPIEVPGTPLVD